MKNNNDDALVSYFSSMLNEPQPTSPINTTVSAESQQQAPTLPEVLQFAEAQVTPPAEKQAWHNISTEDQFQVLFFELANITLAVPLIDLGGIYPLDDSLNSLFGKPSWFSGVMNHNGSMFNIVDTGLWINPAASAETHNYSHYIVLGGTQWGISCEKLIATEVMTKDQIKWRQSAGKRPWVAGMVKHKMCALIHVQELVKMLDKGDNILANNGH